MIRITNFAFTGGIMQSKFFAFLSRMKYIGRWGLMRSTVKENIAEHSLEVAWVAHALAVIENKYYGGSFDPYKVGMGRRVPRNGRGYHRRSSHAHQVFQSGNRVRVQEGREERGGQDFSNAPARTNRGFRLPRPPDRRGAKTRQMRRQTHRVYQVRRGNFGGQYRVYPRRRVYL